jgi:nucleotide-binding universal stress UspA family protein
MYKQILIPTDGSELAAKAAAERRNCDAIFMSSHGRGAVASLLKGSETLAVLAHSDIPTVVYR